MLDYLRISALIAEAQSNQTLSIAAKRSKRFQGLRQTFIEYVNGDIENVEDIRAAADEFVAAMAEQMTAEDLQSENTLYSKIVNLLKIFLQKLGFVHITNSDIKALLHESYKNIAEETQQPPIDNNEPATTENNTEEQAAEPATPTEPNTPEEEQTAPTETEQPTEQEPEAKPKPKRTPAKAKKPKVKPATPTETE